MYKIHEVYQRQTKGITSVSQIGSFIKMSELVWVPEFKGTTGGRSRKLQLCYMTKMKR